ncbi:entericidin A/B family lipoprotein [Rhodovulum sp. DZ06]|uniref:entericidin A/B family lipoprotein n=1 Tax=Rhodovulum sp. DZ06 TaxID=3425126 RepID=UPI003D35078E
MTRTALLRLAFVPFAFSVLAACNTVEGAGRDIQAGGKAVSNAAEEVEQEMQE